jgi:hypothetical protein
MIASPSDDGSPVRRHRSIHRPFARRRHAPAKPLVRARGPLPPLSEAERQRRLDRLAAYLVRTMKACPAPGIAPLRTRDWPLIASVVILPYLLVFGLVAIAPK